MLRSCSGYMRRPEGSQEVYEYRILKMGAVLWSGSPSKKAVVELNELGRQGWEAISMTTYSFIVLLKRRIES